MAAAMSAEWMVIEVSGDWCRLLRTTANLPESRSPLASTERCRRGCSWGVQSKTSALVDARYSSFSSFARTRASVRWPAPSLPYALAM